ncbi:MAG: HDOD domain-containing protein [Desulfobacterales bacterium]|nr:HDOD domain-containing protein [Desulfobacterales bacterium]
MMTGYSHIRPENLPMPDHKLMELIQYSLKENAEIQTLASLVSTNPSLTVQLLGMANSAFFRFREQINTVSDAMVAIGLDQVKSLVLCFAVRENFAKISIPGFDIEAFWSDSIHRGVAARELCKMVDGPVEEAFTTGMLQDIGLLALFFMAPEKADRWQLLRPNLPEDRRAMEADLFQATHDNIGGILAQKWQLPDSYTLSITSHHRFEKPREGRIMPALIHLADLCSAVYTCHDKPKALKLLKSRANLFFDLPEEDVELLLSQMPELVEEAVSLMEINAGPSPDFSGVMSVASQKLLEDNISYRELTWQLQESLRQRDEYAVRLEAELGIAREIQKSLQPDLDLFPGIAAFNLPAYHLSGDFYDFFRLPSGALGFCLGDVSGKGTSAALLMAKAISLFRCLCKLGDNIAQVIEMMNTELYETAVRGMFVTFVGGWFHPKTLELHLINMGHIPPILLKGKTVTRIKPSGPPLGVQPQTSPVLQDLSLADGRLYLYTDGFTEGRLEMDEEGAKSIPLGFKGFLNWLAMSRQLPIDEQLEWIKDQCSRKLVPQSDDLTLMILSGESEQS